MPPPSAERSDFLKAAIEEVQHARFWVLLCISLVCFLSATVWEASYLSDPTWVEADSKRLWFQQSKTWIGVLKEFGYASLIALIIAVVIERSSRTRQELTTAERQAEIADSVFRGVFEVELPSEIVEEATDTILRANLIRTEHTCTFTLSDRFKDIDGERHDYVELRINSDYVLRNVSRETVGAPIRLRFALPGNRKLHDLAHLDSLSINGSPLTDDELKAGDDAVANTAYLRCYEWQNKLEKDQTLRVTARYTMIKERSDNEVWVSLYPSLKMHLNVHNSCQGLDLGADANHREGLKEVAVDERSGHYEWELTRPILPYQGIVCWWRPKNPGGG